MDTLTPLDRLARPLTVIRPRLANQGRLVIAQYSSCATKRHQPRPVMG